MDLPDSSTRGTRRARSERPPPCPGCAGPTWWNGSRQVFPRLEEGRVETSVARGRCKARKCSDFVLRSGELYPHRQYQPDVVAGVVAAVVLGGESPAQAATAVKASAASARRWTGWVAKLVNVAAVLALAGQLWPDGVAGAGLAAAPASTTSASAVAARVLHALEYLGEALVRHVERCRVLVHVLDLGAHEEGRSPLHDFDLLNAELKKHSSELSKKPQVIAANKVDLPYAKEKLPKLVAALKRRKKSAFPISAATGEGVPALLDAVAKVLYPPKRRR